MFTFIVCNLNSADSWIVSFAFLACWQGCTSLCSLASGQVWSWSRYPEASSEKKPLWEADVCHYTVFYFYFWHLLLPQTTLSLGDKATNLESGLHNFSAEAFFSILLIYQWLDQRNESLLLINIPIFQFCRCVPDASRVWWLIKETWVISASLFTESLFVFHASTLTHVSSTWNAER